MRGPAAQVAALPQVKEEEEEEARPRTATAWRRCGSFRGRRRRTNGRLKEGDRGKKSELHSGIEHRSSPRASITRSYIFSTIYTRDLNISRDNAFVCVKKCRRVLLERRRGREEEIRRSSKKMAYKMAFATRSPSGSLVHRDTDAFFFCRPLPTRASGTTFAIYLQPRLSLRLRFSCSTLSSGIC